MTVFLLTIVAFAILGWRWAVALPPAKLEGAHMVLAMGGCAALVGVVVIWRGAPRKST
jgi:hypothetical protein